MGTKSSLEYRDKKNKYNEVANTTNDQIYPDKMQCEPL